MNTLQAQTAYIGSTEIKQVRLGNELVLAPNGDELWYKANELPSLDLRFADDKSLVDATTGANLVDFTRASSGTYVDSEGVIRTATTNLLLRSEEFETTWVRTGVLAFGSGSVVNAIPAPNGSITADLITEDTATSVHAISQGMVTSGVTYTISVYAKAAGRTRFQITGLGAESQGFFTDYNLSSVTVSNAPPGSSIAHVGNGWYRCVMPITASSTTGLTFRLRDASGSNSYTGDGTSGIYLWGAQLEQSTTVGEYIPTTSTINSAPRFDHNPTTGESLGLLVEEQRTNLLLQSEDFSTTWTASRTSITANVEVAPNGTTTADKLIANTDANTHSVNQNATLTAASWTFSVFLKQAEYDGARILVFDGTSITYGAIFDLATGSFVSSTNSPLGTSVSPAGNGFFRCSITVTGTAATGAAQVRPVSAGGDNFAGDGTSGIYLWGAQLEAGTFPTSYIPTTTATATRAADVASISGSNFGVSRTNLLLRSEEFDGASWAVNEATITANQIVAPNGSTTADLYTTSANTGVEHYVLQTFTAAASTTYTASVYAKAGTSPALDLQYRVAGAWVGGNVLVSFNLSSEVVAINSGTATASITPVGNGWFRCRITATSSVAGGSPQFRVATGDGGGTIYLWGAQVETGSTATAYIPTTTAAVTVVESPWYNATQGSIFVEPVFSNTVSFNTAYCLGDGTSSNRTRTIQWNNGTNRPLVVDSGGVAQVGITGTGGTGAFKFAVGLQQDNFAVSQKGETPSTDTSGLLSVTDRLFIGNTDGAVFFLNGTIKRLTYWPTRLGNEVLQTITQ
jgi:hypothetical protein